MNKRWIYWIATIATLLLISCSTPEEEVYDAQKERGPIGDGFLDSIRVSKGSQLVFPDKDDSLLLHVILPEGDSSFTLYVTAKERNEVYFEPGFFERENSAPILCYGLRSDSTKVIAPNIGADTLIMEVRDDETPSYCEGNSCDVHILNTYRVVVFRLAQETDLNPRLGVLDTNYPVFNRELYRTRLDLNEDDILVHWTSGGYAEIYGHQAQDGDYSHYIVYGGDTANIMEEESLPVQLKEGLNQIEVLALDETKKVSRTRSIRAYLLPEPKKLRLGEWVFQDREKTRTVVATLVDSADGVWLSFHDSLEMTLQHPLFTKTFTQFVSANAEGIVEDGEFESLDGTFLFMGDSATVQIRYSGYYKWTTSDYLACTSEDGDKFLLDRDAGSGSANGASCSVPTFTATDSLFFIGR